MSELKQVGHFKLVAEIGHGGMGHVYRAFDPSLNRDVAVKLLHPALAGNPKLSGEFLQEARNAAAISHPHIVQVHLVGEHEGQYYIVMELLRGKPLDDMIKSNGPLKEEQALDLAIQTAEALKAAYQLQMIHGDIKPANIFVSEHGAKILDFGLAKLANVEAPAEGDIWGSPYYMSPERVGRRAEDYRSDIYSLGGTLFHALTGRPPFDAEDASELALKRLSEKPPLLRDLNPDLTEQTEKIVDKMLSKTPLLRFRDYDHLLEQLKEAKNAATAKRLGISFQTETSFPVPVLTPPAPEPTPSRISLWITLAGIVTVALVGLLLWRVFHKAPPPKPEPAAIAPAKKQKNKQPPPPSQPTPQSPSSVAANQTIDRAKEFREQANKLIAAFKYADALALLTEADNKFTTPEDHNALRQHLLLSRLLTEFKTQLAADFAGSPYAGKPLDLRTGICPQGPPQHATETGIVWTAPTGKNIAWNKFTPPSLANAAEFYLSAASNEPPDKLARRHFALAAFAVQYKLSKIAAIHINAAIKLDPKILPYARTLFYNKIPKPPANEEPITTPTPPPQPPSLPPPTPSPQPDSAPTPPPQQDLAQLAETETQQAAQAAAKTTHLFRSLKFADALALLTEADNAFKTDAGHAAIKPVLLAAKHLAQFKSQLAADFARTPYAGPVLQNKKNTALVGTPKTATDAEISLAIQYGEIPVRWEDIKQSSLLAAAQFYLAAAQDSDDQQAARHLAFAVFAKQSGNLRAATTHAQVALRLSSALEADVKALALITAQPSSPQRPSSRP